MHDLKFTAYINFMFPTRCEGSTYQNGKMRIALSQLFNEGELFEEKGACYMRVDSERFVCFIQAKQTATDCLRRWQSYRMSNVSLNIAGGPCVSCTIDNLYHRLNKHSDRTVAIIFIKQRNLSSLPSCLVITIVVCFSSLIWWSYLFLWVFATIAVLYTHNLDGRHN